jgi:hypothetical protein
MLLARSTGRLLQSTLLQGTRCVSGGAPFREHESAVENLYFNKEEERLLRKLLTKVKKQSDAKDQPGAAGAAAAEVMALKNIVSKYNIAPADMEALVDWKHKGY